MTAPIARDANKVPAVVNEAADGKKAVPTELVIKRADDTTFEQISQNNPLPTVQTGSYVRLSTEPKPTKSDGVKDGNDLLLVDTGQVFVFYKDVWREI
ncbi:hypothetical protein [Neobacillus mesonae]|nr:hypothetical protein [Neobacillus mesonae]